MTRTRKRPVYVLGAGFSRAISEYCPSRTSSATISAGVCAWTGLRGTACHSKSV